MTDDTFTSPKHSTELTDEVSRLEIQIKALENTVAELESEKNYLSIESKLAIEDAELARSFSKKNYSLLLDELFHTPAKRLRKQMIVIVIISLVTILALLANTLYPLLLNSPYNDIEQELSLLNNKIDALASNYAVERIAANTAQHSLDTQEATTSPEEPTDKSIVAYAEESTPVEVVDTPAALVAATPNDITTPTASTEKLPTPTPSKKDITIAQQSATILQYVELASTKNGFPSDYANNKTSLAQLYLIIMQNSSNDNIYYESYLSALQQLDISSNIRPTTVADLVTIDRDFLQAAFSAYIITQKKHEEKWRYRDTDREFISYYNPAIRYDLGAWKIVNNNNDYKTLPKIFALNIKRIAQQLAFNNKIPALSLPDTIFYSAYPEASKNDAVKSLLNADNVTKINQKLTINTANIPLNLTSKSILQLQKKLVDEGLMSASIINGIAGPKTKSSIAEYQTSANLSGSGNINLALLKHMGIEPTFYDLSYE